GLRNANGRLIPLAGTWKYWIQNAHVPKVGVYPASYQPCGCLRVVFPQGTTREFRRSRVLRRRVAEGRYKQDRVYFVRSYIASFPDNAIAIRLSADLPGRISFSMTMDSKHPQHRLYKLDEHTLALHVKVKDGVLEGTSFVSLKLDGGEVYEQDG